MHQKCFGQISTIIEILPLHSGTWPRFNFKFKLSVHKLRMITAYFELTLFEIFTEYKKYSSGVNLNARTLSKKRLSPKKKMDGEKLLESSKTQW